MKRKVHIYLSFLKMSLEEPEISSPIQTRVISCFLESPQTDKTISYDKETIDLDINVLVRMLYNMHTYGVKYDDTQMIYLNKFLI